MGSQNQKPRNQEAWRTHSGKIFVEKKRSSSVPAIRDVRFTSRPGWERGGEELYVAHGDFAALSTAENDVEQVAVGLISCVKFAPFNRF